MSVPFKAGARKHFPKAKIIFDKFHVLDVLSVQLDKVRACFLFFFIALGKLNLTPT
jgi:transposase